jgi:hypothetical protein
LLEALGEAEVPEGAWPEVQFLVDLGCAKWVSGARGPGAKWRRAQYVKPKPKKRKPK